MATRDNEAAARALVDASLLGDRKAAERHGITTRTLRNYRSAIDTDPELSAALESCMRAALEAQAQDDRANWAEETNTALVELTREALDLWRGLKRDARSFRDRERVLKAALAFIGQLSEPQLVREVMGVGDSERDAEDQQHAGLGSARPASTLPN